MLSGFFTFVIIQYAQYGVIGIWKMCNNFLFVYCLIRIQLYFHFFKQQWYWVNMWCLQITVLKQYVFILFIYFFSIFVRITMINLKDNSVLLGAFLLQNTNDVHFGSYFWIIFLLNRTMKYVWNPFFEISEKVHNCMMNKNWDWSCVKLILHFRD